MSLQSFLPLLESRLNEYKKWMGLTYFESYKVTAEEKTKYIKIFKHQVSKDGSVFDKGLVGFVDKITGDIYKPASFNAPAKHSRGNINSEFNGMEAISPEGFVKYLK